MRTSVIQRDESRNDLASREISEAIKRAKDVAIYDSISTLGGERALRGDVLGVLDAESNAGTYFIFRGSDSYTGRSGEESELRSRYNVGGLTATTDSLGSRVLLDLCSLPAGKMFDLELGIPRARWEMHVAKIRGRMQPSIHSKYIVMAAPLRMR